MSALLSMNANSELTDTSSEKSMETESVTSPSTDSQCEPESPMSKPLEPPGILPPDFPENEPTHVRYAGALGAAEAGMFIARNWLTHANGASEFDKYAIRLALDALNTSIEEVKKRTGS